MTSKAYIDNHAHLFQDAIFDPEVVEFTRWLDVALYQDDDTRDWLDGNPYTPGALVVAKHMHRHALAVPALRWEHFRPELDCFGVELMLWQLSEFETTLLGMNGHINERTKRLNEPEADAMECVWIARLTAAIWSVSRGGGDNDFFRFRQG
ncbi:hypothetical protein MHY85_10490 [Cellulomonas sp. ACRRI]|uniref:hypothetical protein n=1 Tax=Cellulomonas sp. ACRRI TaxID=2918188 RepID=UPI001EF1ACDD|nr:hypothetical protein [Cellulomonas sp. ACRRI]MCG7286396.1 hypothetical protein [Cellulomonas sp. ACRRI]